MPRRILALFRHCEERRRRGRLGGWDVGAWVVLGRAATAEKAKTEPIGWRVGIAIMIMVVCVALSEKWLIVVVEGATAKLAMAWSSQDCGRSFRLRNFWCDVNLSWPWQDGTLASISICAVALLFFCCYPQLTAGRGIDDVMWTLIDDTNICCMSYDVSAKRKVCANPACINDNTHAVLIICTKHCDLRCIYNSIAKVCEKERRRAAQCHPALRWACNHYHWFFSSTFPFLSVVLVCNSIHYSHHFFPLDYYFLS